MKFDPAALGALRALADDSVVAAVEGDELRRLVDAQVQRRCAALKLGSRIIGVAAAQRLEMEDGDVLASMSSLMKRLSQVRASALALVGVKREDPDFLYAFNAITDSALDMVIEEWRSARLVPEASSALSIDVMRALIAEMMRLQPERYAVQIDHGSTSVTRRIALLESVPRLLAVVNMFAYYQDAERLVQVLYKAVAEQAEAHARIVLSEAPSLLDERPVLRALYVISTNLMCEVYKANAYEDVGRLQAMPELDRAVLLSRAENDGGMSISHILDAHQKTLVRTQETAALILESSRRH